MLSRLPGLLFLFFPLLILCSKPVWASDFPIEIIEYVDDARIVAFVQKDELDPAYVWEPTEGAPKLTIEGALQAVNTFIAEDPAIQGAQLEEIKLEQIPNHKGYWNYLVKMQTTNHDTHHSFFVVLMDGKVIPAIREPDSFK